MPYGVADADWRRLPSDDQAAIKSAYEASGGSTTTAPPPAWQPPQIGAYAQPAPPPPDGGGGGSGGDGGGSGGDGSGGGGDTKLPPLDWATSFFASLGLPADVIANVNKIFTQYSDVNAASAAALGYIRGTSWYATTYPGIDDGIQKGVIANEADYRNLLNQQSQLYKQYLGRDVTGGEFAANLGAGTSLSTISGRLQGAALAGTYGNDWRYTLGAFDTAPSDAEVKALGEENAGLDSPLGQQVKRRLDLATQRLQGVFSGSLATPSLSLVNGRVAAPGLAGSTPDVAA